MMNKENWQTALGSEVASASIYRRCAAMERLPTVAHQEKDGVARCRQQHIFQKLCFINLPEPIIISG